MRHLDLAAHQVDSGDHFGDRMFHLNARIDLDKIKIAGVGILQKLDRSGRSIADRPSDLQGRLAQIQPLCFGEEGGGCPLHDLLIASLHGAVALVQMHQIAVRITQNLHFDVSRAANQLLEIDLILAECRLGLAARRRHRLDELAVVLDDAHAAPTTAPTGLQHHREANRAGHRHDRRGVGGQGRRGGHHRNTGGLRQISRLDLVAQPPHGIRERAHEYDVCRGAGFRKLGTFRQEPIAGMDRVGTRLGRDPDDVRYIEVGLDRAPAVADQVAFVRLRAMQ